MRKSLLIAAVLATASCAGGAESPPRRPPNVLLIVSDDQRHDALSCAGHPVLRTPNLDRLAAGGVRFTHAFVEVPICTPSRAAYLTGRFAASNGVPFFGHKDNINQGIPTWPQHLVNAGYAAAFTGKWHNVRSFAEYGFNWTANIFVAGMGDPNNPKLVQKDGEKPVQVEGYSTTLFTDAAVRFLNERGRDKPFFLYVSYTTPHDPRVPPPGYEKMYDPARIPLPPNFMPQPRFDPGTLDIRDEKLMPLPRDPDEVRRELAKYYAVTTHMDAEIGRILQTLDRLKLADNTIVIFAGDNGLAIGSHGLLGKQTMYDEGVRVPLIVRNPLVKSAEKTSDALVYLVDLFPTVCEWLGLPVPQGIEGKSLAAVYAGKERGVRDAVFGRYDERDDPRFRMVRTDRYKLIRYLKLQREELFDLQADPYEQKDLSGDPAMRSVLWDLRQRLAEWQKSQNDRFNIAAPASQSSP